LMIGERVGLAAALAITAVTGMAFLMLQLRLLKSVLKSRG
jgi:hypothetical protein